MRAFSIAILAFTIVFTSSCSTGSDESFSDVFNRGVSLNSLDSLDTDPIDGETGWDYPDVDLGNGLITRMFWLSKGEANTYYQPEIPKRSAASGVLVHHELVQNKRVTITLQSHPQALQISAENGRFSNVPQVQLESLAVTGTPDDVDRITDVIVGVQKSLPQIEVSVRIVEVLEDDVFSFGMNSDFSSVERSGQPSKSFFNSAASTLGLPELPGRGGSFSPGAAVTPFFLDLGTITNGLQLDFTLRALKIFQRVDLLSAPHLRVLDGHTAHITAGEEIPFFQPSFNAGGFGTISTQFKDVGVKMYLVPKVIGRDLVRINLTTAVESVSGQTSFVSNEVTVTNPIITQRRASTAMDVYDGDTAIIGGLLTRSRFSGENKVPVLGEIPFFDIFLSSRSKETTQSNLLFFITPKIVDVSRTRTRMITPVPTEEPKEGK